MKHWKWMVSGLAAALVPTLVFADPGVTDMNTYMYKDYSGGCSNSFNAQWVNWDDWFDEMLDVAASYSAIKNSSGLPSLLSGASRNVGLNADIIAIWTHGATDGQSGSARDAYLTDYECTDISMKNIEPLDGELEIALLLACDIYTTDYTMNWYLFRNLHRYGAPVSAGCWDSCTGTYSITTSTFNDMGDEIADQQHTIYNGWTYAFDNDGYDADIFVQGLGTVSAGNCDDRAQLVTFQNRLSYDNPSYGHNEPFPVSGSDPELCGYYWTNH